MSAIQKELHVPLAMPTVIPVSEMKWSYSRISTFLRCNRKFYYKYIMNRPDPAGLPAAVGKIVHNAIYYHVAYGFDIEESTRAAIYESGGIPDSENFGTLSRMVQNARYFIPQNMDIQSEVELHVRTRLGPIHAIIDVVAEDLLNDELVLCDFKTGWHESEASDSLQLKFYAWLYKSMRGSSCPSDIKIRLIFPRISKMTEHIMTESDFNEARNYFISIVEAIYKEEESNKWNRTCDKSECEYCPFAGLCASEIDDTGFPRSGDFTTELEVVKAGDFALQYEVFVSNIKKSIRKFVEKHGVVHTPHGSWSINLSASNPKVKATREWMELVEELGLDSADYLEVDNKKIAEILEHDEEGRAKQLVEWTNPRKSLKFNAKTK